MSKEHSLVDITETLKERGKVIFNSEYNAYWGQRESQRGQVIKIERPREPWYVTADKVLPDLTARRVLEIGCGVGNFALWMGRRTPMASITAVDFSEVAIATGKKRSLDTGCAVTFVVSDGEALCFESESFDVAVSCECLEHVPSPEKMTREIYRMLIPGGRFVLTTENYVNGMVLAWIKSWLTGVPYNSGSGVQPRENFFVFWRVKHMLERSGLVVDHMESNHFQWLLLPRVDPAKLCKQDFKHKCFKRLFRPFGRHFTFSGFRPE